jgi:hypothetical protein
VSTDKGLQTLILPKLEPVLDAATANWTQQAPYSGSDTRMVFLTHWVVAAAAVAVGLLGAGAALPLYSGWWYLGRRVSLSPLELARASDAALLRNARSKARADGITAQASAHNILRYGALPETAALLAEIQWQVVNDKEEVGRAEDGRDNADGHMPLRLRFDDFARVVEPQPGSVIM